MTTSDDTASPKEPKPIKFKTLAALRAAKSRKKLPRGLKADFSLNDNRVQFKVPKQDEPVFETTLRAYVEACLKADGFKLDH